MDPVQVSEYFNAGGTLPLDAPYIERSTDEQLFRAILAGEYCNVLTPRQMGKSSLMVRTVAKLKAAGFYVVTIDLGTIGVTNVSLEKWYFGLISHLKRVLDLNIDEKEWWNKRSHQSVVLRFSDFLRDVILKEVPPPAPVVIFIDEIDTTLKLSFADDFFIAIRAVYNARATEPIYKRLTFVLLGVARPADLIKDRARTPYNIGHSIDLKDFTLPEARKLLPGLVAVSPTQAETILERVLYWTGGHPYLTQKVCRQIVASSNGQWTDEGIDALVKQLFLSSDETRKEINLQDISERIQESSEKEKLLQVYRQVLLGKLVMDDERDPVKSRLKLTGLLKVTPQSTLVVRNRIYETAFNLQWVKENMPKVTANKITLVAVVITLIALAVVGVLLYRQQNSDQIQAQTYSEGFLNTQSAVVRLTNLAGLFRLGGQFAAEAHNLFFNLNPDQQLAMFTELTAPEQVGKDLQSVIEGVYTSLENNEHHNALLQAMADSLNKIGTTFPDSRILNSEIRAWLEGRRLALTDDPQKAIEAYDRAISYNDTNPAVYMDRAMAYTQLEQYEAALLDLDQALKIDPERHTAIITFIQSDPGLSDYLAMHQKEFSALADLSKK